MTTDLACLRRSILAAMGLALACGPGGSGPATDSGSETSESAASTESSGDPGTGDPSTGTDSTASGTDSGTATSTGDPPTTTASSGPSSSDATTTDPTSTSTTGAPVTCEDPTPILQEGSDEPSGFVICADGTIHREAVVTCLDHGTGDCNVEFGACMKDSECVDKPLGLCVTDGGGFAGCTCQYGCTSDEDCAEGSICACPGVVAPYSVCIPSGCSETAACGDGALCALATDNGICGELIAEVACLGPEASCHADADCPEDPCYEGSPQLVQHICWPEAETWSCKAPEWCGADCGRPFLIDEELRVAGIVERGDFAGPAAGDPELDDERAAIAAAHWRSIAQLEHASVASFARASLQLMALGAPPDLLAETRRATADELAHARLAFALAGRLEGRALGPGPLAVDAALAGSGDLRAIVTGLVREACVGETLAAAEAACARDRARDPATRRALARIADDEARHAALGWRALRWIVSRVGDARRREIAGELTRAIAAARALPSMPGPARDPALEAHGLLDAPTRAALHARAVEELLVPLAGALIGQPEHLTFRARSHMPT